MPSISHVKWLLAMFVATLLVPLASAQNMRAHFLDVGQGAAAILEFPCAAVLIDTGGETNNLIDSTDLLLDELEDFFAHRSDLKNTFHLVVLTHPHIDHTRGARSVLQKYRVLNALTNGQEVNSSGKAGQKALHRKVAESESNANPSDNIGFEPIRVREIPSGRGLTNDVIDPIKCESVDPKITALWGEADRGTGWTKTDYENENNHSVVLRIDFGKASMLLTGDLETRGIAGLLAKHKGSEVLNANVYLVGHHGAANATTEALLRAVTPDIAVISMGSPSRHTPYTAWAHGHPRKVIVDLLTKHVRKSRPAKRVLVATGQQTFSPISMSRAIYATGWDGKVVLEGNVGGTWRVVGEREPMHPLKAAATGKLNINTASADDFEALPMIGRKRANDIVRFRSQLPNDRFGSVDEIGKVPGIGAGTMKAIRPFIDASP